ncbi:outer dynein arm-docking complex subunit 2-like isoform X1 [Physella acuta]|uniref:outer dynein arm-docking complex subunit 2-like isoform X1 n=2 Tax=Physella acuta TaxID=109671 RepID=UPI0027DB09BE|nr:outer dynein arm-docking complex subunit 2-like isoform X1 [Physella acuta]
MGQTLQRAAQWTSAQDGTSGKLEFTSLNEELLNTVLGFLEDGKLSEELNLIFKKPLEWKSTLSMDNFEIPGYKRKYSSVVSEETSAQDSTPLLELKKDGTLKVHTLGHAINVLKIAGEKKLIELRTCLEGNRDPVAKMLGDRFATVEGSDNSIFRFHEEILKESEALYKSTEKNADKMQELEDKKKILNLRLKLLRLDEQMLNASIIKITNDMRLNPKIVDGEVTVLKKVSGSDKYRQPLEDIIYYGETYVYQNGCRAQPWRQLNGDICYLAIKCFDIDSLLYVTANTSGYYFNKGPQLENNGLLDYERADEETYRELVSLLKAKSPHFADLITRQEFTVKDKDSDSNMAVSHPGRDDDGEHTNRSDRQNRHHKDHHQDRDKTQKTQTKAKLEPSLKWKNLTVEEENQKQSSVIMPQHRYKSSIFSSSSQKEKADGEEAFSESSTESEEEEETIERRTEANADLPTEYWQIQKLVKYLKGGNQTATIIALCSLRDFNLSQETCQLAIRDVGGLEVLINLLDTEEVKCKIGALKILKEISRNSQIRRAIADLGGLQTMVKILRDQNKDLKCLAAETIAHVAKFRRARRTVRQHGGIKRLVNLLDCVKLNSANMTPEMEMSVEVARCGALALWSCSKSKKNKEAMRKAGAIPLLAKLLKSEHENMLIPVVGTLQECASEPSYGLAIRTEGMVEDLVKNLKSSNTELQMHCASAIFKCAVEKETRDLVRQYGGLDPLVGLLSSGTNDKQLLAAATGAIWKCSISPENVQRFQELKAIDLLVGLLNDQPEEVLVNVVGALGELAKDPPNRQAIRKAGGIPPLVNLLTGTNQALLVNVTCAVGHCAEEADNMAIIDRLDGVRLLWSLLKNHNKDVQASAAWAICPCIENAKDAGEMVRSFVGGLELIVSLLKSEKMDVLAAVCAAIANIAKDEENLAVITDHGVVPMLARLTNTTDDKLRRHLAEAIARCCSWGNNRISFGKERAVAPLVRYLKSKDENVHRSTARALFQLSKNPENCITMHEAGVVKPLIKMVGSKDEDLQESSAGCIGNIRRLALANEKARYC